MFNKTTIFQLLAWSILLLNPAFAVLTAGANQMRSEQELSQLEEKIGRIKSDLKFGREQETALEVEISGLDKEIAALLRNQQNYIGEIKQLEQRKVALGNELKSLMAEGKTAQSNLGDLVRASYLLAQQDSLKLLLSQGSPSDTAITLAMYRYIVEYKREQVEKIRKYRGEIEKTSTQIELRQREINRLQEDLDISKTEVEGSRNLRQKRLEQIQSKLSNDQQQVHLYRLREVELRLLLENLRQREQQETQSSSGSAVMTGDQGSEAAPGVAVVVPSFKGGFGKNRGRLPMPARASVENRFGDTKPESGLIWEGLMLNVKAGQEVKSIYNGQVIYSDWFRGYGQLLVIDHGDGYMSLYGHNQLLHVELGNEVAAGQLIATAGSTGGLIKPGLYFEIRHNGIPDDPLQWCRM